MYFFKYNSFFSYIKIITFDKWYNFSSVLINGATSKVLPSFQRVEDYNQASLEVCGTAMDEFIQRIESRITECMGDDAKIRKAIRFDISSIVWEAQFSHISPPFFFCPVMLPIYEMGHLPCGWRGPLPPENWKGDPLRDLQPENIRVF